MKRSMTFLSVSLAAMMAFSGVSALAADAAKEADTTATTTVEETKDDAAADAEATEAETTEAATDESKPAAEATEEKKEDVEKVRVAISIDHHMAEMRPGRWFPLQAKLEGPKEATEFFAWESSDPEIATVDAKGRIFAKKTGTCTIYGTIGDVKIGCRVVVSLAVKPYDGSIKKSAYKIGFVNVKELEEAAAKKEEEAKAAEEAKTTEKTEEKADEAATDADAEAPAADAEKTEEKTDDAATDADAEAPAADGETEEAE